MTGPRRSLSNTFLALWSSCYPSTQRLVVRTVTFFMDLVWNRSIVLSPLASLRGSFLDLHVKHGVLRVVFDHLQNCEHGGLDLSAQLSVPGVLAFSPCLGCWLSHLARTSATGSRECIDAGESSH